MKKNDGAIVILLGLATFVISLLIAGISAANAEIKISYEPQEAWSASTKKDDHKPDIRYWRYRVKGGDTLSGIVTEYLGGTQTWQSLADNLRIKNPDKMQAGQWIDLPVICRVIWDNPDGTTGYAPIWNQDCQLVRDWAKNGNDNFPNLNHRVQEKPKLHWWTDPAVANPYRKK